MTSCQVRELTGHAVDQQDGRAPARHAVADVVTVERDVSQSHDHLLPHSKLALDPRGRAVCKPTVETSHTGRTAV